ncbi:PRC and DUF2382 domain-containing protein [Streptomyces varsoviensis]|uniref:Photosystem reaction center subunit H n=1 Tax=Streptomyces varsoviensis TaxID=67373 RepID=A0ABR5JC52_9ACTN|nr:PRC and DUF2382 domain-containing protein [Streptomyces varsoviensis]KOG90974.1 hypothetical protein ADK38_05720 [Streptomyces varsoviensis]
MTAPHGETQRDLSGMSVVDTDGHRVGSVQQVYRDDRTGDPEWITVRTGLFGMKETFVPLAGAKKVDGDLRVPHSKDTIKDAPRIDADGHLDPGEEDRLYEHYGLTPGGRTMGRAGESGQGRNTAAAAGTAGAAGMAGAAGRGTGEGARGRTDTAQLAGAGAPSRGRDAGDATAAKGQGEEMILSEERVSWGTEERESGRAHLRKHVVTEDVSQTVPVSHEEVTVHREAISPDDRRAAGRTANLSDGETEVVLHEEVPVVRKETVPVERVRMDTKKVSGQQEVRAQVRKEEVEYDDGLKSKHQEPGDTGRHR